MKRRMIFTTTAVALWGATLLPVQGAHAATEQLRFNFDAPPSGQAEPGPWTAGCFANTAVATETGCVAVATGGSLGRAQRPASGGTSPAVQFPAADAGKALIRVPHADHLNPGTGDFTITAMVKLASDEVSSGANVVQKGVNGTPTGQWKLQVDNGRPECKIIGLDGAGRKVSAIAGWTGSIADKGWSFISCKRRGDVLSIAVGGATPVESDHHATMDIGNTVDVTIGAKGLGSNNDQFHGAMDNVTFSTG